MRVAVIRNHGSKLTPALLRRGGIDEIAIAPEPTP